ncbi:transcriptional regulator [Enterobacterales bacterium]|nr:transcriptional regulator [Enterobacterales bacterium]
MTYNLADTDTSQAILERLEDFYRHLDNSQLPQLSRIYHPNIVFIDPVGQHNGVDALEEYFRQLLKTVNYCRFDIQQSQRNGNEATLVWRMDYAHPKLNKGQNLSLDGISHLRLADDLILYQRDYYDLGAMLYEHVPLLGTAVRALKARLKS